MSVEFILALGLIVALNELKEWRASSRLRSLERAIASLPEKLRIASERNEESLAFAHKASGELDILLRTIDAHGIRVNYRGAQAEQPDFVEGL